MEILVALAERPGEIVPRKELLARVWGGRFVGEEVLSHAIWDLRRALGEDPAHPRFIHTHRKMGYRLVGEITWSRPRPSEETPRERHWRGLALLLGGAATILLVTALLDRLRNRT